MTCAIRKERVKRNLVCWGGGGLKVAPIWRRRDRKGGPDSATKHGP